MNSSKQLVRALDSSTPHIVSEKISQAVVIEPVNLVENAVRDVDSMDRLTTEQIISHEPELSKCKKCCKGSRTIFCGIFCCCVKSWSCCLNSVQVCCGGCSIACICMSSVALCCKAAIEEIDCDGN
jgi:hypothetical protein